MGTRVKVEGKRIAAARGASVVTGEGRVTRAVTFDNVHEAATRRMLEKFKNR